MLTYFSGTWKPISNFLPNALGGGGGIKETWSHIFILLFITENNLLQNLKCKILESLEKPNFETKNSDQSNSKAYPRKLSKIWGFTLNFGV